MVQYEMYFTNEYTEEIVYDLVGAMGLHVEKKEIQAAIQEKNTHKHYLKISLMFMVKNKHFPIV